MRSATVRRAAAPRHILMMVVSFAATVVITRYYLMWSGYPQLGGGELHIAHLLWGGLALFIGGLLPLIFANRRAYDWAAVLSGVGVGLFIDEVGKFITKSNDYFYPAAAPIIYGFFLLTVVLYLQVRRRGGDSPRAQFYAVLDQLPAVIDGHLEPDELAELTSDLRRLAAQDSNPALAQLAARLLESFAAGSLPVAARPSGRTERWWAGVRSFSRQHLTRRRHRVLLALGLGLPQVFSLLELGLLLLIVLLPDSTTHAWGDTLFTAGELDSLHNLLWFVVRFWLDGIVGLLAITGTVLLLVGKERPGLALGVMALVLSLTVNNLLTFYLDQFEALTFTLVQAAVLLLAVSYRRRYRGG